MRVGAPTPEGRPKRRRTCGKLDEARAPASAARQLQMILLHVAAAALYALTVGALWPQPAAATAGGAAGPSRSAWGPWLLPAALLLHAWAVVQDTATAQGLDFSL